MPDPHRVYTRSVKMLTGRGMPMPKARDAVKAACDRAMIALAQVGIDDVWWLEAIYREATYAPGRHSQESTQDKGGGHGGTPAGSHRRNSKRAGKRQQ